MYDSINFSFQFNWLHTSCQQICNGLLADTEDTLWEFHLSACCLATFMPGTLNPWCWKCGLNNTNLSKWWICFVFLSLKLQGILTPWKRVLLWQMQYFKTPDLKRTAVYQVSSLSLQVHHSQRFYPWWKVLQVPCIGSITWALRLHLTIACFNNLATFPLFKIALRPFCSWP